MTFSWESSQQPTRLVPHIVYADSCAVNNVDVFRTTVNGEDVDDALSWRSKLALLSEKYDVGNSPSQDTREDTITSDGTPTISATDITLSPVDWFNRGGTANAGFPTDGVGGADTNAAWLT